MSGGDSRLLGKWGERLVAEDLRRKGWLIRDTNFRCRMGELDLIAEHKSFLVFVEVKLRKNSNFSTAKEAVTKEKQRKLRTTAEIYLAENPTTLQPRFDVAEVYAPEGIHTANPQITYIENAF